MAAGLMMKTLFVFAYYSYRDPVFQSAVLPLIRPLHGQPAKFRVVLLTFEQPEFKLPSEDSNQIRKELASENIIWIARDWHSGKFKLLKKAYDLISGVLVSLQLIRKYRANAIYSEGFPGCIISDIVARLSRRPHLIHTFEPHADYMIEGGVWKSDDWEARLLKRLELGVAKRARLLMTATEKYKQELEAKGVNAEILRFPSVVDPQLFSFSAEARAQIRRQLAVSDSERLLIYLGKFGGMYWEGEIATFFKAIKQHTSTTTKLVILTGDDPKKVAGYFEQQEMPLEDITITKVSRDKVPAYLSAADFGICAVKDYASKRYCSPIKDGEFWACGLPFFIPTGVSDDFEYAEKMGIGITIHGLGADSFVEAAQRLDPFLKENPTEELRKRCRQFALEDRSLESFHQLLHQHIVQLAKK